MMLRYSILRSLSKLVIFSVALGLSSGWAQTADQPGWDSWASFISRLAGQNAPFVDSSRLQIVTQEFRANWKQSNPSAKYDFCRFADSTTVDGLQYKPSGGHFREQYQVFVDSIALPKLDSQKAAAFQAAAKAYYEQAAYLSTLEREKDQAWKQEAQDKSGAKTSGTGAYQDWYKESGFQDKIRDEQKKVNGARQDMTALVDPGMAETVLAVYRARDVQYIEEVKGKDGTAIQCPQYSAIPSIEYLTDQKGKVSWTYSKESSAASKSSLAINVFAWGPFLKFRASAETMSIDLSGFHVEFDNLGIQNIQPGSWYSQVLVNTYRDGPFVPGSVFEKHKVNPSRPKAAIVGSGALFAITLSQAMYTRVKHAYSSGSTISIGPYDFGQSMGSANHRSQIDFDDSTHTVSLKDLSSEPMILAVVTVSMW